MRGNALLRYRHLYSSNEYIAINIQLNEYIYPDIVPKTALNCQLVHGCMNDR